MVLGGGNHKNPYFRPRRDEVRGLTQTKSLNRRDESPGLWMCECRPNLVDGAHSFHCEGLPDLGGIRPHQRKEGKEKKAELSTFWKKPEPPPAVREQSGRRRKKPIVAIAVATGASVLAGAAAGLDLGSHRY